jgi:hypothetical protein
MAEYYPLISRTIAGLGKSTIENRRVLYDRARSALVGQLRNIDPPLSESDITHERLALEEAIRKVEAEAVRGRTEAPESAIEPGNRVEAAGQANRAQMGNRAAQSADGGPGHLFEPPAHEPPPSTNKPLPTTLPTPPTPQYDGDEVYSRPRRSFGRVIKFLLLLLVLAGLAGAGYWQRGAIIQMAANLRSSVMSPRPTQPAQPAQPTTRPKIADRVGSEGGAPPPATTAAAAVAQKVVLYEEDANDPKGKRYVGSAIWRTETVSPGAGLPPELAVRADVEIPERHMRMTYSLRRNTDQALPASHTIEIIFTLPADFDQGGIGNVPGVLMKSEEQARGVPLAGLAVKVTNGYFLIGLSAVDVDKQRNIKLMKDEDWLDIPIVYTSGKRAILAVEKGTPGNRVFEEAFRAWGE